MSWLVLLAFLIQTPPIHPEAVELVRRAEAMINTDKAFSVEQADLFEEALVLQPDLASARFNLALIYLKLESYGKAETHLSRLLEIDSGQVNGRLLRAEVYLRTGRPELAEPDLKQVVEAEPADPTGWQYLGRAQFELNDLAGALESFSRVQELAPEDREVDLDLGLVKQNLGQSAAAAEHFEHYLETRPDNLGVLLLAARSLRDADQLERSLAHYLKAESLSANDTDLRREIAYLYLEMGRLEEADERLQDGEGGATDLANRALIALRENRLLDAELGMRRALSMEPDNPAFWLELGEILFLSRQMEPAAQAYQRSLELGARSPILYRNLGTTLANLKQPEKAREMLEAGLALEPGDGTMHFHLAVVLERLEQPEAARDHFLEALAHGNDEPRIHFRLAVLYSREGDSEKALEHLTRALEADPEKFFPLVDQELRNVRSDFDAIRYTAPFGDLIKRFRERLSPPPRQP